MVSDNKNLFITLLLLIVFFLEFLFKILTHEFISFFTFTFSASNPSK